MHTKNPYISVFSKPRFVTETHGTHKNTYTLTFFFLTMFVSETHHTHKKNYTFSVSSKLSEQLARLFTGHDQTRVMRYQNFAGRVGSGRVGSGQVVFEISRAGSSQVSRFSNITG